MYIYTEFLNKYKDNFKVFYAREQYSKDLNVFTLQTLIQSLVFYEAKDRIRFGFNPITGNNCCGESREADFLFFDISKTRKLNNTWEDLNKKGMIYL